MLAEVIEGLTLSDRNEFSSQPFSTTTKRSTFDAPSTARRLLLLILRAWHSAIIVNQEHTTSVPLLLTKPT